jgi:hypothetical protein
MTSAAPVIAAKEPGWLEPGWPSLGSPSLLTSSPIPVISVLSASDTAQASH